MSESSMLSRLTTLVRRYWRDKRAIFGLAIVIIVIAAAFAAPLIAPYSPTALVADNLEAPSKQHVLGTDNLGRDMLSRVIWGSRTSLLFGLGAAVLSVGVGVTLGVLAGFFGGAIDIVISRLVELVLVIPRLFLILVAVALFGSNIWMSVLIVGLTIWPDNARLVRAQVLSLKERQFVEAAVATGAGRWRLMWFHLLPNAVEPVIPNTTLQIGYAILLEASLGFLGLGDPNRPGWGVMLRDAQIYLQSAWWMAVFPGAALALVISGFMFMGDGVSRVFNKE